LFTSQPERISILPERLELPERNEALEPNFTSEFTERVRVFGEFTESTPALRQLGEFDFGSANAHSRTGRALSAWEENTSTEDTSVSVTQADPRRLFGVSIVELAGVPFQIEIAGVGFSTDDRLRVVQASSMCGTAGTNTNDPALAGTLADDPNTAGTPGTTGDISTSIRFTGLVLQYAGRFRGCYCVGMGDGCVDELHFSQDIGSVITSAGADPNLVFECVKFAECILTVTGVLSNYDKIRIISPVDSCGVDGTTALSLRFPEVNMYFVQPQGTSAAEKTLNIGKGTTEGEYLVCYCPNYQSCTFARFYTHPAGTLHVRGPTGLEPQSCKAGYQCTLGPFTGHHLSSDDYISTVATTAGDEACGTTARDAATEVAQGALMQMTLGTDADGEGVTTRDLAAVDLPKGGVWKVCYCANYDIDADDVICAVTSEYTTEAGLLTVHGAAGDETFYCPKDGQCLITITGTALTTDDRVQVIDFGGTCGTALMSTLYSGDARATSDGTGTDTSRVFDIGIPADLDDFTICYCSDLLDCDADDEFSHFAGTLVIRGPAAGQDQQCTAGKTCTLGPIVGAGLSSDDKVFFADDTAGDAVCGVATKDGYDIAQDLFIENDEAGVQTIVYNSITFTGMTITTSLAIADLPKGGVWKVCYCSQYDNCDQNTDFRTAQGALTVMGADATVDGQCARNTLCTVTVTGTLLNEADVVEVVDNEVKNGIDTGYTVSNTLCNGGGPVSTLFGANRADATDGVGTSGTGQQEFELGIASEPGLFRLCYFHAGCTATSAFTYTGATVTVRGPGGAGIQDFTCYGGRACTLGPVYGQSLTSDDAVSFLGPVTGSEVCGTTLKAAATQIGQGNFHTVTLLSSATTEVSVVAADLPKGGVYRMCYCANYKGCDADIEMTIDTGDLSVRGPAGEEHATCTAALGCTIGPFTVTLYSVDDAVQFVTDANECAPVGSGAPAPEVNSGNRMLVDS
jgi:hypothetical protein